MRNLTKDNITEAFLKYSHQVNEDGDSGSSKPPRAVEIIACLAKHLHAFALETSLTHDEWETSIDFLKAVADKTTKERDEFILLSDVLGLSSLVDMIASAKQTEPKDELEPTPKRAKVYARNPTSSSVLGPFHLDNPPKFKMGADLKRDNQGELVLVQGGVVDAVTGNPIAGATVNVWQTAPNGLYCTQDPNQQSYNFHGLLESTGEDGLYSFTTAKPVAYQVPTDGPVGDLLRILKRHAWRPSHLHFIVQAQGYRPLVTEIFPNDDFYLDEDAVFGVREDLVVSYQKHQAGSFPKEGFDLSETNVDFWKVDFDMVLIPL